jgi:hypothetical protein
MLPNNILSTPLSKFESDLAVNVSSVYAAAQEAVTGFDELPKETLKHFIYTGNRLNIEPMPMLLSMLYFPYLESQEPGACKLP